MLVTACTDTGYLRTENQDAYWYGQGMGGTLLLLADGMGGHAGGATASRMAVSRLKRLICPVLQDKSSVREFSTNPEGYLHRALGVCHRWIQEAALNDPRLQDMGTTVVLALIRENRLFLTHVGDSRAYLYRKSRLERLTRDHSAAVELGLEDNSASGEGGSALGSMLTQALGSRGDVHPSYRSLELHPDDQVLLCSDGLSGEVGEEEMGTVLASDQGIDKKAGQLLQLALHRGGRDNVTLLLGRI